MGQKNIAILVANGFDENHITEIQRALARAKLAGRIVAPEQGLVNGWRGEGWGHHFAVDVFIGTALGSDYDALVLVGGERAVTKLKTNPHTRRIVNHFVEAKKPIAAIGMGTALLALSNDIANVTIAAPHEVGADLQAQGACLADAEQVMDGAILTAKGGDAGTWAATALTLFVDAEEVLERVAA